MSYYELEPGDEDFLEECPVCKRGYMVPIIGKLYQCSECGVGAEEQDGLLWWDKNDLN